MTQPTAVIAEDEPLLRGELKETLGMIWGRNCGCSLKPKMVSRPCAQSKRTCLTCSFWTSRCPGSRAEVARAASGRCHVVFVTAYDQYAVTAFKQGAVDYVMKPFTPSRLAATVQRVKERLRGIPANLDGLLKTLALRDLDKKPFLRWISASQGQNVRLITVEEICYFQADNKYTLVTTADAQSLIRKTIRELVDELDPDMFSADPPQYRSQCECRGGRPSRLAGRADRSSEGAQGIAPC